MADHTYLVSITADDETTAAAILATALTGLTAVHQHLGTIIPDDGPR